MSGRTSIHPLECRPVAVTPTTSYVDRIAAMADQAIDGCAKKLVDDLTKSSLAGLKEVVKLDNDPSSSDGKRRILIHKHAEMLSKKHLSDVLAEFNSRATFDLDRAAMFGLDSIQTKTQAEAKIKADLAVVIREAIQGAYEKMMSEREELDKKWKGLVEEQVKRICLEVKTRVEADDLKELRRVTAASKNIGGEARNELLDNFIKAEINKQVPVAMKHIADSLNMQEAAESVGLNLGELRQKVDDNLKAELLGPPRDKGAVRRSIAEAYSALLIERQKKAEARESFWANVRWGSVLLGVGSTGATVAVLGTFSAPFWVPVGAAVTGVMFVVARSRERAAADRKLRG